MCDVDYGDRAAVWSETRPKARIAHTCHECRCRILPGVVHVKVCTLDEGQWWTWRAHVECHDLLKFIAFDVCQQQVYFIDGELRENVREHMREAPEVLRRWRDILRARRAEGSWPVRRAA